MKFVIAVDGSKPSETAFSYVLGLGVKKIDEILLVTSLVEKKGLLGGKSAPSSDDEQRAKDLLAQYETRASAGWMSAFGNVLRGDPRRTLPQFMKESGADLLVMGARGLGPLKRVLLGSVSSYVVQHCHCAVMVVKNTMPISPRKFLYCYDGSEASKSALPFMLRLTKEGDSVFVVHVVQNLATYQQLVAATSAVSVSSPLAKAPSGGGASALSSSPPSSAVRPSSSSSSPPTSTSSLPSVGARPSSPSSAPPVPADDEESPEEQATIKHEMEACAEEARRRKLNALVLMEHGEPREVVNRLLQRLNIDMAVAGSSGRSGMHWWSTGSFSTDLVQNAVCNAVLVVKPSHAPDRVMSESSDLV